LRDLRGKVLKVLYRTAATWHRVIPDQVEAARILQLPFGFRNDELLGLMAGFALMMVLDTTLG